METLFRTVALAAVLALSTVVVLPGAAAHNPDYSECMWHPEIKLDCVINQTLAWAVHCVRDDIPNGDPCIIV